MVNIVAAYPQVRIGEKTAHGGVVADGGMTLLTGLVDKLSLTRRLDEALAGYGLVGAKYSVGKILSDLALMLALGGQNPSDLARLRVQESVFGTVASTPTVSRVINRLAEHADEVTSLIQDVISGVREMVWEHAWTAGKMARPTVADPVIIDVDATLVNVHSEKEGAAPTFKRGFGFHPVLTAIDLTSDAASAPVWS